MLEAGGVAILNQGEFSELMKGLEANGAGSGTLQAWWGGEQIAPSTLFAALNVEARLAARTAAARAVIDRACARMQAAFPNERFMKGRAGG